MITIKVLGIDQVRRSLSRLQSDLRDQALVSGINKTADKAKAEMVRAITDEYALKRTDVAPRMSLRRAHRGNVMAVFDPFGSRRRGRSLNLIHFLAAIRGMKTRGSRSRQSEIRRLGAQLGFQIRRRGGLKHIRGAFIGNQGRTVFVRAAGQMKSRPGKLTQHSQAIKALSTIDVPGMFGARRISGRVVNHIRRELPIEIERAVNYVIKSRL